MSSWRTTATVSTGFNAWRATGLTTVPESDESFTRTESVARWSRDWRASYEAERIALPSDFFYTGEGCSNQPEIYYRGTRIFFFPNFSVSFTLIVFAVLLCRAVLSLFSCIQHILSKEEKKYPTWGMYVRTVTARDAKRMWRPSVRAVSS